MATTSSYLEAVLTVTTHPCESLTPNAVTQSNSFTAIVLVQRKYTWLTSATQITWIENVWPLQQDV